MAAKTRKQYFRAGLAMLILAATVVIFVIYLRHNPQVVQALGDITAGQIALLFALYSVFMLSLVAIQASTIALCGTKLTRKENFLLTIYSSIINFFGPLQSGPGFRAAYLKQKHGTKLKNYTLATLLYYGFYALFSGLFLLSGIVGGWGITIISVLVLILIYAALQLKHPFIESIKGLHLRLIGWLAAATLLQVVLITVIYYIELHAVGMAASWSQVVVYAGAANFALFVSITPGAIGFRESFLLFSRDLHHIPANIIATASLIDRAVYVLLLAILFVVVASMHAKQFLSVRKTDETPKPQS